MKKKFSIFLALIFLSSNLGFAIGTHYCGEHAVINKVVFSNHDLACGMDMMMTTMRHSEETAQKNGCCENVFMELQIKDNYKSGSQVKSPEAEFFLIYALSYYEIFNTYNEEVDEYHYYNPPPLDRDLPVLFQSFII